MCSSLAMQDTEVKEILESVKAVVASGATDWVNQYMSRDTRWHRRRGREHSLGFCYPPASCTQALRCSGLRWAMAAEFFDGWWWWWRALAVRERMLGDFNSQAIANIAWAFDSQPFKATSRLRQWRQEKKQKLCFAQKYFPRSVFSKTDLLQYRLCHDRSRTNRFRKTVFTR